MGKRILDERKVENGERRFEQPKKLSKAGEWMRANPNGIYVIHDMRAAMR